MSTRTADYLNAVEHLPDGATLVVHQVTWDEYERLLEDLSDRPHLRVSYDRGKLDIMSPLPEHEDYARFIDDLVRAFSDTLNLKLEKRGSATWKRKSLARAPSRTPAITFEARTVSLASARSIWSRTLPPMLSLRSTSQTSR